jgi:hypothetical protein
MQCYLLQLRHEEAMVKAEAAIKVEIKMVTREEERIQMAVPISNLTLILMRRLKRLMKLRPTKKRNLNLLPN